jgi:hypothetical protein
VVVRRQSSLSYFDSERMGSKFVISNKKAELKVRHLKIAKPLLTASGQQLKHTLFHTLFHTLL